MNRQGAQSIIERLDRKLMITWDMFPGAYLPIRKVRKCVLKFFRIKKIHDLFTKTK